MSLETKLIQLAVENRKSASLVVAEYLSLLQVQKKYTGMYFRGRESHLKFLAYRNLLEIYGVKK